MAIVKVQLKKHRKRDDGTFPVVIYIYEKKPQYVYTGYAVKEDQFKEGQGNWIRRHPDATVWNTKIEDKRQEVSNSIVPGVGYVEGGQTINTNHNFCEYLRYRAGLFKKAEQIDMGLKCSRYALEIKELLGRDIYSREIDLKFIRSYMAYCKAPKRDKNNHILPGNSHNTIMRKVKNLRTLYGQAISEGFAIAPNPFEKIKTSLDPVNKQKLNESEITAIEALSFTPGQTIFHVRNAFLFSYYCQGMRFESVCVTKHEHIKGGVLLYQMEKGKKWRELTIHPKLRTIINWYLENHKGPYLFPFLKAEVIGKADLRNKKGAASTVVNEFLKIIGDMAGVQFPLKFHEARHTFAYQAKKKGVYAGVIQDALGHTDSKTTENYLNALDDDLINDAVRAVYE